jgi:hypothetical protein
MNGSAKSANKMSAVSVARMSLANKTSVVSTKTNQAKPHNFFKLLWGKASAELFSVQRSSQTNSKTSHLL